MTAISPAPTSSQIWDSAGKAIKATPVPEHDELKSLDRFIHLRDRTSGPGTWKAKGWWCGRGG